MKKTDGDRSTLTNTTLDDRDPNVTFSGDWTQQNGPNFFNQTSTYTQGAGNAFEFKFEGKIPSRITGAPEPLTRLQVPRSICTVTRSTITALTPCLSTLHLKPHSTIAQVVAEGMQKHVRSYLGSSSLPEAWEKGNTRFDSRTEDPQTETELSSVRSSLVLSCAISG